MAVKTLPKSPEKPPRKIIIPMSKKDLHQALDMIMEARTIKRTFGEVLLQTLWTIKCRRKAQQISFARAMDAFLNSWISGDAK